SHLLCIRKQVLRLHHLQYRDGSRTRQMIATECRAQQSKRSLKFRSDRYATERKTVAHTLCHGVNIGLYSGIIMRIERACTPIAALHRICNKHSSVPIAQRTQQFYKWDRSLPYTSHPLDTFDNNGSDFIAIGCKCHRQGFFIVEWQKH